MEENTTISEENVEENTEISSEDLQADIQETTSAVSTESIPNSASIVAPGPGSADLMVEIASDHTYNGYTVYYNKYGDAYYYDSNGFKTMIFDVDNIVKGGTEETTEDIIIDETVEETTEEVTTEETTEEVATEETTVEETTEEVTTEETTENFVETLETYVEVPFLEKPINEYSVSEGLLLLIFVLGIVAFVYHIIFD